MKAKIIGVAITLFWLAMMSTLLKERLLVHSHSSDIMEITPVSLAANWQNQEEWMRILYKGNPVGAAMASIRKRATGDGYLMTSRLTFQSKLFGITKKVSTKASALLDKSFVLRRFAVDVEMAKISWSISGIVRGRHLFYRFKRGANETTGKIELEKPPSLLDAVRSTVGYHIPLKVGKTYRIPVFDPVWSAGGGIAEVRVVKKESLTIGDVNYKTFRVETTLNNITTVSWVSPDGKVLQRRLMPDIIMQAAPESEIVKEYPAFAQDEFTPELPGTQKFAVGKSTTTGEPGGLQKALQGMLGSKKER